MTRFQRYFRGADKPTARSMEGSSTPDRHAAATVMLAAPGENTPTASGVVIIDAEDDVHDLSEGLLDWLVQQQMDGRQSREAARQGVLGHNRLAPQKRLTRSVVNDGQGGAPEALKRILASLARSVPKEADAAPPPTRLQRAMNQRDTDRFGSPRSAIK